VAIVSRDDHALWNPEGGASMENNSFEHQRRVIYEQDHAWRDIDAQLLPYPRCDIQFSGRYEIMFGECPPDKSQGGVVRLANGERHKRSSV
jgi:hypothetical protein